MKRYKDILPYNWRTVKIPVEHPKPGEDHNKYYDHCDQISASTIWSYDYDLYWDFCLGISTHLGSSSKAINESSSPVRYEKEICHFRRKIFQMGHSDNMMVKEWYWTTFSSFAMFLVWQLLKSLCHTPTRLHLMTPLVTSGTVLFTTRSTFISCNSFTLSPSFSGENCCHVDSSNRGHKGDIFTGTKTTTYNIPNIYRCYLVLQLTCPYFHELLGRLTEEQI